MSAKKDLFTPIRLGAIELSNRMLMSPMTRNRGVVPNSLNAEYYAQRASAGLIVAEGTLITRQGAEWHEAPGIWSQEQVKGWKGVTDAVHKKGGKIFDQLWHVGRLTHPLLNEGGAPAEGPSPIAADGGKLPTKEGIKTYVKPIELTEKRIQEIIQQFKVAAENAKKAGFDGVEIHGAFGYLPDQFLHDGSNQRTDKWGGSIANRCRFLLTVADEVTSVWGAERVGLKLSPCNTYNGMKDSDSLSLYTHLINELDAKHKLAYLHIMEPSPMDLQFGGPNLPSKTFRKVWRGPLIANLGYKFDTATAAIANGDADAVAFGQLFLANPDLPKRFKKGAALNSPRYEFLYTGGPAGPQNGYTDYPFLEDATK